ncbi:MAG: hypothetical protein ACOX6V_03625 [Patescibacteria group bacterium]|jgi:hypothetical protein
MLPKKHTLFYFIQFIALVALFLLSVKTVSAYYFNEEFDGFYSNANN